VISAWEAKVVNATAAPIDTASAVFFIVIICTLIDSLPIIQRTNINVY